jgi:hypothetical protein
MYKTMSFVVAVAVALVANSAVAGGPKGPRGSAAAVTVCELNLNGTTATFDVDILVSDVSSGDGIPTGVDSMVDLMGKASPGRWENQVLLAMASDGAFVVPTTIMASFDLCAEDLTGIVALNALVEVTYDDGNGKERTVKNRCGDDPATYPEVEPDGIPLDQATKDEIDAICNP